MKEQRLEFLVKGSAPDPYRVTFVRPGLGELFAYCTCPAGEMGQYCKHRFGILRGSTSNVVSRNFDQVATIKSWLAGSELEAEIERMHDCEEVLAELRKEMSDRKKRVARVMRGHS